MRQRARLASACGLSETGPHRRRDPASRLACGRVLQSLPVGPATRIISLGEGATPLIRLDPFDTDRIVDGSLADQRRTLAQLREAEASLAVAEAELGQAGITNDVSARGQTLGLVSDESARATEHQRGVAERQVELRRAQVAAARALVASSRLNVSDARRRRGATGNSPPPTGTVPS